MQCCICGKEFKSHNGATHHIKQAHQCASQEYHDKYIALEAAPVCKYCGKPVTLFLDLNRGYATTLGIACIRANAFKHVDQVARMQKIAEAKMKKYGSVSYNNSDNGVIILYRQDIQKYLDYIKDAYGINYLSQFKNNKNLDKEKPKNEC